MSGLNPITSRFFRLWLRQSSLRCFDPLFSYWILPLGILSHCILFFCKYSEISLNLLVPSRTTLSLLPCGAKLQERLIYKFLLLLLIFHSLPFHLYLPGEAGEERVSRREALNVPSRKRPGKKPLAVTSKQSQVSLLESNPSGLISEQIREEVRRGNDLGGNEVDRSRGNG